MVTTQSPLARAEHTLSRHERASRTDQLAWCAYSTSDPAERRAAQAKLIELNVRVARAVASRYRGRGVAVEDLEQAACEGLLKAVRRFDPSRHHDLLSYAVPTMRGEVLRYFRDVSWMVRPPRRIQELQSRISRATESLALDLGRDPTPDEICARLDITREEHDEALSASGCFQPTALDQLVDPSRGDLTLGDCLPHDGEPYATVDIRVMLLPLLQNLDQRERRVLYLRFFEGLTQREIGAQLGVAQMQVSRWLTKILAELRSQLEQDHAA
ncbi:sigma-70 family RNA polymerase sigma factor [Pseudactinotalea terrae]|uniref:sigma-70 family RNA polymerase sigma factor n=1 Tax=Pseudactinotalea terrae TaxID=1743262 RepID=UPI0012E31637|nr:sigma-70 family RNA polymerase sigma factor [Pseudactinotalea terrae]